MLEVDTATDYIGDMIKFKNKFENFTKALDSSIKNKITAKVKLDHCRSLIFRDLIHHLNATKRSVGILVYAESHLPS